MIRRLTSSLHRCRNILFSVWIFLFIFITIYYLQKMNDPYTKYPLNIDLWRVVNVSPKSELLPPPINDPSFSFLIPNPHKCSVNHADRPVKLLLLIKSHPRNCQLRQAIRNTWGNESCWRRWNVKRVFMFGRSVEQESALIIARESNKYGDIIQQDFIDFYTNNTYKTLMGMKWTITYCKSTQFVFFLDDDFFVIPDRVMEYLSRRDVQRNPYFIGGHRQSEAPVMRTFKGYFGKNRVKFSELDWDVWPPFLSAGAFVMNHRMIEIIWSASRFTKYFRMDDVYLGIILYKLGIEAVDIEEIYCWLNPVFKYEMLASHAYNSTMMKEKWKKLVA